MHEGNPLSNDFHSATCVYCIRLLGTRECRAILGPAICPLVPYDHATVHQTYDVYISVIGVNVQKRNDVLVSCEVHNSYVVVHRSVLRVLVPMLNRPLRLLDELDRDVSTVFPLSCFKDESIPPCTKLNPELVLCMKIGVDVITLGESRAQGMTVDRWHGCEAG